MNPKVLCCWLLIASASALVTSCRATETSPEPSQPEITQEVVGTIGSLQASQQATFTLQPPPSQISIAPSHTPEPILTTETTPTFSDEELSAQGRYGYVPPELSTDHPCWILRFQSSRFLRFDFQGPNQLIFDPSSEFFVSDTRVPAIVHMSRSEQNVWIGEFSASIEDYNFSLSEEIVFEEDGIIWHEIIRNSRSGYFSDAVECGPAKWTRAP